MSRLDDLIAELCPDGVEYKTLGGADGVCEILLSGVDKAFDENERHVKLCNYMDVYNNQYITKSLIVGFMDGSVNDSEYQKFVLSEGQVLLTKDSETKEDIAQTAYVCDDFDNVVCGYHVAVLTPKSEIIGKYLNYVLQSHSLRTYFSRMANGVSRHGLKLKSIEDALIPLPPLPVQQEIVRILDKFTALEAELEAELEARKKQYEYYRDELLRIDNTTPMRKLGEIATITRGGNFQKKDFSESGVPCIHYGQIYTKYALFAHKTISYVNDESAKKSKFAEKNDVIMAVTSENLEDVCKCVAWLGNESIAVSGHTAIIHHNQNPKYLAYYFHTSMFFTQKRKLAHGTKVIEVTPSKLLNIGVPIPPIEEQERIVSILDRFDILCNDLTSGLPAEIEARRKQYEYYRDKLLTFKEYEEGDNYID
jgi:type I restriction enzyme S subunit